MNEETGEQVVETSLEDRIANLYDDPNVEDEQETPLEADEAEDEAEEAAEEESAPELVEVEFDGKRYTVPPELQSALMKNADYTQKTQELSAQRQAIELQAQEVRQAIEERDFIRSLDDERQQIAMLDVQLQQYNGLNWNELSTDEMVRYKHNLDLIRAARGKLVDKMQEKQQKFISERSEQHQEFIRQGQKYLNGKLNGWNEEKAAEVRSYAVSLGFPEAEVKAVVNPLHVEVLYKAMQFDRLKGSQAVKRAQEAPPIVKPGSVRKMPDDVKQKLNFRKKMKTARTSKEKADLIQERMAEKLRIE